MESCQFILANIPSGIGRYIRYIIYKPFFRKAGRFNISTGVTIKGFKNIELGNDVTIMSHCHLYAQDSGEIIIRSNCMFNSNVQINAAPGKIKIGKYCRIGPNTVLRATNHSMERTDIPICKQKHEYNEIIIEDDVWIASNCVITAGTILKTGTAVGAGAVVTKNFPAFSVLGGVPAKVIRNRREKSE